MTDGGQRDRLERVELVIVGAGAAGLMAAIWAGRGGTSALVLDGARMLGAKILVAGGGRCNVTHDEVTERDYSGSTPPAIRRVLRAFDVAHTVEFFRDLGIELKREPTGKLFPVTDSARTVLDALLRAAHEAGATIRHPRRVEAITPAPEGFRVEGAWGALEARRVILAGGGMSLPKSGSDGSALGIARSLGHSVTPRLLPALVGLTLEDGCFVRGLTGLASDATLEVRNARGRRVTSMTGALLCTHFGVSGPVAMDISRHWQTAALEDPGSALLVSWLPGETRESLDGALRDLGGSTPLRYLSARLPARLARALCEQAGVDPHVTGHELAREARRALVRVVLEAPLPVTGTRGWSHAEATAGGVPLAEVRLDTMESRIHRGLYLSGELLDVDGRIGGYNFQWAWSSGYVAGTAAGQPSHEV